MTKTEQMIATLIERIDIIRNKHQDAANRQDLAAGEADALFQEFRAVGETVASLPSRFKSLYSHAIAWEDMEVWADPSKFRRDEFTLGKLTESWAVLAEAESELRRHNESFAAIQRDTIAIRDMQTMQIKQDYDHFRRTPHVFLWFTAFLIPLRAGLAQIGWEITSWQMAAYLLVVVPLWMMMRENRRERDLDLSYPAEANDFYTQTQFCDASLWGRLHNIDQLKIAVRDVRRRLQTAERIWMTVIAISTSIAILDRIMESL